MKILKNLVLSALVFFSASMINEVVAQQINHIAIAPSPSVVSPIFKGTQYVEDCGTNALKYSFSWTQAANTAVPYFGAAGEVVFAMEVCDAFGECVLLGAPWTGLPNTHTFVTGDQADYFINSWCQAHVEIWHP